MREKIALLIDYEQSVKKTRQVLFSSTKREASLPRQVGATNLQGSIVFSSYLLAIRIFISLAFICSAVH